MTFKPANTMVWFELPVSDLDKAIAFYNEVFQTELERVAMQPNEIAMFPVEKGGRSGHLYPGKPPARGTGPTIHLLCPDKLVDTMERFVKAGGEMVSDPITIPAGTFAYGMDPDGNSIGLFTS